MDDLAIIFFVCFLLYLFVTKPKFYSYKFPEKELGFKDINLFCYRPLKKSLTEFDQDDLEKLLAHIYKKINELAISSDPYDIIFELNIRIDNTINFYIISSGSFESQLKELKDKLSNSLCNMVSKSPRFFDLHCILRYYNSVPLYSEEEVNKFKKMVIDKKLRIQ